MRTTTYDEQYDKTYSNLADMIIEEALEKEDDIEGTYPMDTHEAPKFDYDIDETSLRRSRGR